MSKNLTCNACQQQLSSGQYVNLETSFYHLKCFVCFTCKDELGGKIYFEKDSQIYCENDYHQEFGQKCYECNEVLKDSYLSVLDKNYHKTCFVCILCKNPFKDSNYYSINNQPFCKQCAEKSAQVCAGCQKPITDKVYSAIDQYWHITCFRCAKCKDIFKTTEFSIKDKKAYHQECCQLLCCVCNKACKGEYYEVGEQQVHEECLEEYKSGYKQGLYQQKSDGQEAQQESKSEPIQQKEPEKNEEEAKIQETQKEKEKTNQPEQEKLLIQFQYRQVEQQKQPVSIKKYQSQMKAQGQQGMQLALKKTGVEQIVEGVAKMDLGQFKIYPYEVLKNQIPEDVDTSKKEMHLSDEEFLKIFKMAKAQFAQQPKWKQQKAKKEQGLI